MMDRGGVEGPTDLATTKAISLGGRSSQSSTRRQDAGCPSQKAKATRGVRYVEDEKWIDGEDETRITLL